ncbi:XdhC/CoxI family protein [Flagellimonas taeanensis]|uniref:XdhC family protein n=1 Tax=Flavobacteriaceae TaxID=49546 RepID=UPI000E688ED3|nr:MULTISPECIES: XdhC/CoxI family protein [Allomuricauda]MDC6386269.1 XdhC family protein [Muricauda sp. SK9]RIV48054.1 XdhC/CoxI family protein [Allomuricauda taeanensis]
MTHELKSIIQQYEKRQERAVLATVAALDGSSYRRPGVRMLIFENGDMVGAVSGGCVEKEVLYQAQSVFSSDMPKVMTYDGRYRLGCEGILYILLEPFAPNTDFLEHFWKCIEARAAFQTTSYFQKEHSEAPNYRTVFHFGDTTWDISSPKKRQVEGLLSFHQEMDPCFRLLIIGAEHDAVQLCQYASLTGWEVTVVANPREEKTERDFPGIHKLIQMEPESFTYNLDDQTAVVIMTHSFVKDLQFVMALKEERGAYIGLLGPAKRKEKLFGELLERCPDISESFLERLHGPAGIDIGAETPQEISISILAEILSTINKIKPQPLKHKEGKIHS